MPEDTSGQKADKEAGESAGSTSSGSDSLKKMLDKNKEKEAAKPAKTKSNEFVSQRVLVVEDARILRKMLVKILQEKGIIVDEAGNGHEALALLRRSKSVNQPYDLIITDLMMPEMDGWELIDQLIERKYFPGIPVIVITATASVDSVKRCARAGVRHYIVKPFETMRVVDTVRKALASGVETKSMDENSAAGNSTDGSSASGVATESVTTPPAVDDDGGSWNRADSPEQEQQRQAEGSDVASASAGG